MAIALSEFKRTVRVLAVSLGFIPASRKAVIARSIRVLPGGVK
jgi:hypothetical protein